MTWGKRRAIIIVLVILAVIVLPWFLLSLPERVPSKSVLVLEIGGDIEEQRPPSVFPIGGPQVPVQHDFTDAIDAARNDSRIAGLVVKIGPLDTGWAKIEELHDRLLEFRKSRKPSVCYLAYDGVGNPEYYLATGCDQVWLVPTDPLDVRGMMAESLFVRGTLDKLKVYPDYYHIAEYKTAMNQFTEKKFTPAHKEMVTSILQSIYGQYLAGVARARSMDQSRFAALVEQGPYLAKEALANKLVDRLAYWDEVRDWFQNKVGEWNQVSLGRYHRQISNFGSERIAVVHATGLIVTGDSDYSSGNFIMGSDSVAEDLRTAREDNSIKAIVFRIDSGGGSAVASEIIRREIQLARKAKPVIASMSDVAGSGGYWIAMSADKIVAEPATITASIGVFGGKPNVSGLFGLLGLSTDSVSTGDNASLYSLQQNFTPAQRAVILKQLQEVYANFTAGVAEGRKMKLADVDRIGKGRVWSGAQARDLGLVDELGGMDRAIALARQMAGIPANRSVQIDRYPKEKSIWEQLFGRDSFSDSLTPSLSPDTLAARLERLARLADPVQALLPFRLRIR